MIRDYHVRFFEKGVGTYMSLFLTYSSWGDKAEGLSLTPLLSPKWHVGQVEHGDNWGIFWSNFLVEKITFFYND